MWESGVQLLQDGHSESQLESDIYAKIKEGPRIIPGDIWGHALPAEERASTEAWPGEHTGMSEEKQRGRVTKQNEQ